jgi:hypothetical protein
VSLAAAHAWAATVVIVRPTSASPALTETVSRLQGELLSLGLDVAFAGRAAGPDPYPNDPRARLEPIAAAHGADAVIDVGAEDQPATADIYVLDRRTARSELLSVRVEDNAADRPARLAIRAIEVLRSNLVELDLARRGRPTPLAVRAAPPPETPVPAAAGDGVALEAGAAVLTGVDGIGPALLPTARVERATRFGLALQLALAGFGTRPLLTAPAGGARLAQQFGLFGISTGAPSTRRLRPYAALAAGVLRTAIDGEADPPAQANAVTRWSFLVEGSAGARVRLPGRTFLTLAAHVQIAAPYVAIHVGDTVVATTGRPNLLFTLTVGAWL